MQMNAQEPNPYQSLNEFLQIMKEAQKYGYEISDESSYFGSSPIEVLLESMVDILLLLKDYFRLGVLGKKRNTGLRFSQRYSDPLGNPKQIKISYPQDFFFDPDAEEFFTALALCFIAIRKSKGNVKKSFHDFSDRLSLTPKIPPTKRKANKQKANQFYWRRHIKRLASDVIKEL